MSLSFYREYSKSMHPNITQYKIDYLKSIIQNDLIYKFIAFDENAERNASKLNLLIGDKLWFSYYKRLNDKTEFSMKYNVQKVSKLTGISADQITTFIEIFKEIYDVCSFSYAYEKHMWSNYANSGNGICLVFKVLDYDMLYPVEYVNKDEVDYTDMLVEAYTTESHVLYEKGIIMAELPFVIKNPINGKLKSYCEKEVRILKDPFSDGILNYGRIYPGVKDAMKYRGRSIDYKECGIKLNKIIMGNKCTNNIKKQIEDSALQKGRKDLIEVVGYEI